MEDKIYRKLIDIQQEIDYLGKDKKVEYGNTKFKYRGIDDALNYYSEIFKKHGVVIIQLPPQQGDYINIQTADKNVEVFATIRFRYLCEDGSYVDGAALGSGRDSGGCVAGKVMAYALKYFLNYTFLTPTEEKNIDSETTQEEEHKTSFDPKDGHSKGWGIAFDTLMQMVRGGNINGKIMRDYLESLGVSALHNLTDDQIIEMVKHFSDTKKE